MTNRTRATGAVIVTRVSTGEQVKHGTSLESQLDMCRKQAASLGLAIVAEYEDAGISGGLLLSREGMQAAIADIKAGRANTLICANISRYSRDVEHQQSIRKEVRSAGGSVVFCDMQFDDTPEGDLAFSIMGGFAEYERKVIRSRMMRGRRKRAEEGQQPARSRAPYGYHIVTHADITRNTYPETMLGRYTLDPVTAPIAKRIFDRYGIDNYSLPKICLELNNEGVPTPGGGYAWHVTTLHLILRNPVYKGEPVSGRIKKRIDEKRIGQVNQINGRAITTAEVRYFAPEDEWITLRAPAIVSEYVWDNVQTRLPMRSKNGGSPKQLRMLSGLTFCPYCGAHMVSRMQIANKVKYYYYCCSNRIKSRTGSTDNACTGDLYPISVAEQSVIRSLKDAMERPEAVEAALVAFSERNNDRTSTDDISGELKKIDRALTKLKSDEAVAIRAQLAGIQAGASADAYAEVFGDISAQRKDLANQRGLLNRRLKAQRGASNAAPVTLDRLWQTGFQMAIEVLNRDNITGAEKRAFIGKVVEKVVCNKEGGDIHFAPGVFEDSEGEKK